MLPLTLKALMLPAKARVLVMHATEAEPLLELEDRTAGGVVVAVAASLREYSALQAAIGPRAGAEVTVVLEELDTPPAGGDFDAALLDSDTPSGRGNAYVKRLIESMARSVRPGGELWIEGSPHRGVQTFGRYLDAVGEAPERMVIGGGRRALRARRPATERGAEAPDQPPPVIAVALRDLRFRLQLQPGVFASRHLDEATALLIQHLHLRPGDQVLDLGCGAGAIGIAAALLAPGGAVVLADASPLATQLAEANVKLNALANAEVVLSDAYSALQGRRFDVIATNPPFHVGAAESRDVAAKFIRRAPAHLRPNGRLYVVANAFLPYERRMAEVFPRVETVVSTPSYKVLLGQRRREREAQA